MKLPLTIHKVEPRASPTYMVHVSMMKYRTLKSFKKITSNSNNYFINYFTKAFNIFNKILFLSSKHLGTFDSHDSN